MKKRFGQALITGLVMGSLIVTPVMAEPGDDVASLEQQKNAAEEQAASVNQQLVGLLVDYNALQQDIETQGKRITEAEDNLQEAEAKEKQQYEDMKLRIRYMYEEGDTSVFETMVSAKSYAELVNKAEYVQNVHQYDRNMLKEYMETKNEVAELKTSLEAGQAEMESMAVEMESQKSNLESTLTTMRSQIADFDSQLAEAEKEAAAQLQQATQQSGTMTADASSKPGTNTGNSTAKPGAEGNQTSTSKPSTSTGNSQTSTSKPSTGTGNSQTTTSKPSNASLGQQIANRGCDYIGNPYVLGGNSLTNGIDCSGFVYQIHKQFGISTPRQSGALASGGKAISYADKLPGDVICYSGHVAIYIGNNTVVHASNSQPYPAGGIKTSSPANYRTVLAVRRYW